MWLGLQLNFSYIQPIFEDLKKCSSNLQSRGSFPWQNHTVRTPNDRSSNLSLFIDVRRSAHYCDIPSWIWSLCQGQYQYRGYKYYCDCAQHTGEQISNNLSGKSGIEREHCVSACSKLAWSCRHSNKTISIVLVSGRKYCSLRSKGKVVIYGKVFTLNEFHSLFLLKCCTRASGHTSPLVIPSMTFSWKTAFSKETICAGDP